MSYTTKGSVQMEEERYIVVRSCGCYGSSETVYAARVSKTYQAASTHAAKLTRSYRIAMQKYGGSSGGYRVIKVVGDERSWQGWVLDQIPDA